MLSSFPKETIEQSSFLFTLIKHAEFECVVAFFVKFCSDSQENIIRDFLIENDFAQKVVDYFSLEKNEWFLIGILKIFNSLLSLYPFDKSHPPDWYFQFLQNSFLLKSAQLEYQRWRGINLFFNVQTASLCQTVIPQAFELLSTTNSIQVLSESIIFLTKVLSLCFQADQIFQTSIIFSHLSKLISQYQSSDILLNTIKDFVNETLFHSSLIQSFIKDFLPELLKYSLTTEHLAVRSFSFQVLSVIPQFSFQNRFLTQFLTTNSELQNFLDNEMKARLFILLHPYGDAPGDPLYNQTHIETKSSGTTSD